MSYCVIINKGVYLVCRLVGWVGRYWVCRRLSQVVGVQGFNSHPPTTLGGWVTRCRVSLYRTCVSVSLGSIPTLLPLLGVGIHAVGCPWLVRNGYFCVFVCVEHTQHTHTRTHEVASPPIYVGLQQQKRKSFWGMGPASLYCHYTLHRDTFEWNRGTNLLP